MFHDPSRLPSARVGICVVAVCTASFACSSSSTAPSAASDAAAEGGDDAGADAAPAPSVWGQPCTVGKDANCGEGLLCLQGPSGGKQGFCTKTCPKTSSAACAEPPEGTAAFCVVTDANSAGDKACAFVCKQGDASFTCPGDLKCQTSDEPAGSGQFLCLP